MLSIALTNFPSFLLQLNIGNIGISFSTRIRVETKANKGCFLYIVGLIKGQ